MSKAFVIDVSRCSGCYNCQLACKDEHADNDWSPYAKPQPDIGQFWIKVHDYPRGTIPKVKIHYVPKLCNHCEKAACAEACAFGAIYRRDDGLVLIDPDKCTGCGACVDACPYEAIYFNEKLGLAQKCTGCAHLLDHGLDQPRCVEACPTGALIFGEESELAEAIRAAKPLEPDTCQGQKVFYKNIPGMFIGGTVYDPIEKEVVIGAKCVLTSPTGSYQTQTDGFGDFWFKDLAADEFELTIEAKGFKTKSFVGLNTDDCINLGDIPLDR